MDRHAVIDAVGEFLDREGIPFALIGALALHTYGYSRATNDVDLLMGAEAQDRLVEFLEGRGFETLHRSGGYSNHLHPDSALGRLDVVYVDPGTRRKILADARRVVTGGREILVPSPEHLAAMKVHAMRNDPSRVFREMADIQFLMGLAGVDRGAIRAYFEQANLLERFRELESTL